MIKINKRDIKSDYIRKVQNLFGIELSDASDEEKYIALAGLIKDYISEKWVEQKSKTKENRPKQVYYFSMEFLIGRLLESNLMNLGIREDVSNALNELNISLDELVDIEFDAGLGNGGLGRLAACFLDSMASVGILGHGNCIRYEKGFFTQKIKDGHQLELPDNWLEQGNPWETKRQSEEVEIKFYGRVVANEKNPLKFRRVDCQSIKAVPYDVPIVGYNNNIVNTLRLWKAESYNESFDFKKFNQGLYVEALEEKIETEAINQVLYPGDTTTDGKLLRLKQQYFFTSAGIQRIVLNHKKQFGTVENIHKYVQIQINDTHPAVGVAEMMRILIDKEDLSYDKAWDITTQVFAYTNHTILSEALEKWDITLFRTLLPRIYMIIEEINNKFKGEIYLKYGQDMNVFNSKLASMEIIRDGSIKMAHLAIVGSHSVNGVAKLHTEILKNRELKDFYELYEWKFNNKTNGITHRRWLMKSNPSLYKLINETIGEDWIYTPKNLEKLSEFTHSDYFLSKIDNIKRGNKLNFCKYMKERFNMDLNPDAIFDTQIKRLHAYKRQILNIFHIMDLYNRLKANPNLDITPRIFIFGAKAAPSYILARETIKLINTIADKINNDTSIQNKIKVIFLENYNVSFAEKIIPATDVSEQISTTTYEASGTGNMKFMMNGAVTIATLDGANVEMHEELGDDNIVIFGMRKEEAISVIESKQYSSKDYIGNDFRIQTILNSLIDDSLGYKFYNIYNHLTLENDPYFVLKDFSSYVDAQNHIDKLYKDKKEWAKICLMNIAHSGRFSSDNTIKEYNDNIWHTKYYPNNE